MASDKIALKSGLSDQVLRRGVDGRAAGPAQRERERAEQTELPRCYDLRVGTSRYGVEPYQQGSFCAWGISEARAAIELVTVEVLVAIAQDEKLVSRFGCEPSEG